MTSPIGIIGTGDYGRALANRLLRSGHDVIMGSRNPDPTRLANIDTRLASVTVKTSKEVLEDPDIQTIFLAIHSWNFVSVLSPSITKTHDKIFIDISNRDKVSKTESNAEKLVEAFPGLRVVKAFNTLSAYALESDTFGGAKQVLIASDDSSAREKVSTLAREMGFTAIDYGVLKAARDLEAYPITLMSGWGCPMIFVFVVFLIWTAFCGFNLYKNSKGKGTFIWDDIPLGFVNRPIALTAITVLAVSYLPGCLAAVVQIANGTKYKRFPDWFDRWLKSRKMLGLSALFLSFFHVLISGISMSSGFMRYWYNGYHVQLPANASSYQFDVLPKMNLVGELTIFVGIIALLLMSLLGLASLPSVGATMNWREWRFVQSHIGYLVLFLVTLHTCLPVFRLWIRSPRHYLQTASFIASVLSFLVLFMKLFLVLPGISHYIERIRSGWERNQSYQILMNEV